MCVYVCECVCICIITLLHKDTDNNYTYKYLYTNLYINKIIPQELVLFCHYEQYIDPL